MSLHRINFPKHLRQMTNFKCNLGDMRASYADGRATFGLADLSSEEPIAQFDNWFNEARNAISIHEPNACNLATCTRDGRPSNRMVLLKGYDQRGFAFCTHFKSRKGIELDSNPYASMCFYWSSFSENGKTLVRQVRIEGSVSKGTNDESEKYFYSRPRESQISAAASPQSTVISSKEVLLKETQRLRSLPEIPKPEDWGLYVLAPSTVEFWQGQTDRLHDRIRYSRVKDTDPWCIDMLAP